MYWCSFLSLLLGNPKVAVCSTTGSLKLVISEEKSPNFAIIILFDSEDGSRKA